jgi:hypothetical protein
MTKRDKERLARLLKAKPEEVYFDRDDDDEAGVALYVGKHERSEPRRDIWGGYYYPADNLDKYIGGINIQQTSCCGMAEITNAGCVANMPERVRPLFLKGALEQIKGMGYGGVVATTIHTQRQAATAFREAGFKAVERFTGRTGNRITLWSRKLRGR